MTVRPFVHSVIGTILVLALLRSAAADPLDDVTRLHRTGRSPAALDEADRFLHAQPRDPRMRFLKAGILADLMRNREAVEVLARLTEDYPDLPEPYNNLATLHAASGEYTKARAALEQALRLRPDYGVAHENLGDVYAALASQSYAIALRLQPNRADTTAKLALVRELVIPRPAGPAGSAPVAGASAATR